MNPEWILFKAGRRRVDLVQGEVWILFMAPRGALRCRRCGTGTNVIIINRCVELVLVVFNV